MARAKYHNLEGLLRDLERACRDGDYAIATRLGDLLDDIADAADGDASIRATEDPTGEGADDGLDLPDQQSLPTLGGAAEGHDTLQHPDLDLAARLGHAVERITQLEQAHGRVPRDAADLATTVTRRRLVGALKPRA